MFTRARIQECKSDTRDTRDTRVKRTKGVKSTWLTTHKRKRTVTRIVTFSPANKKKSVLVFWCFARVFWCSGVLVFWYDDV